MARNRFVLPEVKRLPLSDGDWIEVKVRLNYGEQQELSSSALSDVRQNADTKDTSIKLDMKSYNIRRLGMWLTDWSFQLNGKPTTPSESMIGKLDPDTVNEIDEALSRHIEEQSELKKATDG